MASSLIIGTDVSLAYDLIDMIEVDVNTTRIVIATPARSCVR